jgi:hypothetical protein
MMKRSVLALTAFVALSASPALADRPCLQFGHIWNWKPLNRSTLVVEDDDHKKFRLKLIGVCENLDYHERLAFQSRGSFAISCLSPGDEVITRDFGDVNRCAVTRIEAYTPEMEQADKADQAAGRHHGY